MSLNHILFLSEVKGKSLKDNVHTMMEAKIGLKWLLEQVNRSHHIRLCMVLFPGVLKFRINPDFRIEADQSANNYLTHISLARTLVKSA